MLKIGQQFEEDGNFKRVWYEGPVDGPAMFLAAMKMPENQPVFIYRGQEPIGVAWLNGFSGTHATAHFCLMKKANGIEKLRAGKMALDYWMSWEVDGRSVLDVLIAAIPDWNAEAAKFAEGLGFKRVGIVPKMLHNKHTNEVAGAIVLYYLR